jgi:hypothetical protein
LWRHPYGTCYVGRPPQPSHTRPRRGGLISASGKARRRDGPTIPSTWLIRLKRIYNFLCSMLVYAPFALCFVTLRGIFMHFPELTY